MTCLSRFLSAVSRVRIGLIAVVFFLTASAASFGRQEESLLRDASFELFRAASAGPWEFRYGHKGGNYPKARPRWQCRSRTDADTPGIGRYLSIEKDGAAAGAIFVGQRVKLPDPLPVLDLAVRYQSFCENDGRSGIVTLGIYSPALWDRMCRDPEQAMETAPTADIFQHVAKFQGDDVTTWALARVPPATLRAALRGREGTEVVVSVSFLTWHSNSEEWARFDDLWLGPPLPYIAPVQWPRYVYGEEPVVLTVGAWSRDPDASVFLEYRALGSAAQWQRVSMAPGGPGLFRGTIPASSAVTDLEARACVRSKVEEGLETEIQTMRLTQRPEHPNLFYSKSELARMQEKLEESEWAKRVYDGVKARADSWLEKEFSPEVISGFWWHHYNCRDCGARLSMEGPRRHVCGKCGTVWDTDILFHVYWSKMHGDHARAARDLALTYQMTGDEKYARRAIEFLLWYADHYAEFPASDKGGKVVSQTLDECVWLLQMMNAADLAYPAMAPEEARHIERDLIHAGAMYTRKYRGGIHNIRCWHNSCWASAGYFVGDPELVDFARNHRFGFVAQMEKGVLEDGMWYERSMGYHSYTVMAITYHLKAAMHAGDDLYRMPQVRKLLTFPILIAFPNLVPPSLNDGGFSTRPIGPNRLELAAAWYGDPVAISALRKRYEMGASRANMEAWQFGEALPEGIPFTPPPSRNLKGAGLVVLRKNEGADAVCAMLEYGEHGGGHGHPDKLQLILYGLGRQLCPDLGTTGYANPLHPHYYKTTPAHNTVTIGGRNMAPLSGRLLAFSDAGPCAAAVAQSTEVYKGWTLTRRLLLCDRFLVDEFALEGEKPDTLDWFLRSDGTLTLTVDTAPLAEAPLSPPFKYLKELRGGDTAATWVAVWAYGPPEEGAGQSRLLTTMKGTPGTQVAQCEAPGAARRGELWDTLRVRRVSASTRFLAVHQMVPAGDDPEPVVFADNHVRVGARSIVLPEQVKQPPLMR